MWIGAFLCTKIGGGGAMDKKITREECIQALKKKFIELDRIPKKSDFPDEIVARIKAFYGPWPRALEEAEIKECRSEDTLKRKENKKIRAKIRLREYKIKSYK